MAACCSASVPPFCAWVRRCSASLTCVSISFAAAVKSLRAASWRICFPASTETAARSGIKAFDFLDGSRVDLGNGRRDRNGAVGGIQQADDGAGQIGFQGLFPFGRKVGQRFFPPVKHQRSAQVTGFAFVEVEDGNAIGQGGVRVGIGLRIEAGHLDLAAGLLLVGGQQLAHPAGERSQGVRHSRWIKQSIEPDFKRRIQAAQNGLGAVGQQDGRGAVGLPTGAGRAAL